MKMIRILGNDISGIIKAMQPCAIPVAHNLTHRMYGRFTYTFNFYQEIKKNST